MQIEKNKGITLVALIITVIILLILATITVNLLLGDNGILAKLNTTKHDIEDATNETGSRINNIDDSEISDAGDLTLALSWNKSDGTGIVKFLTAKDNQIQYKKTSTGNWTNIDNAGTVNASINTVVYAQLKEDTTIQKQIKITESNIPKAATVEFSSRQCTTIGSVTATVTQDDDDSGVDITKCKWIYTASKDEIGTTDVSKYTGGTFNSNPENIELRSNTTGTYYLHVLTVDYCGNKRETISDSILVEKSVMPVQEAIDRKILQVSDFVKYDTNGYTGLWQILYTDKGCQMISASSVKALTIGSFSSSTDKSEYTNLVQTLNNATKAYNNNSKYISATRCVGSNPTNPTANNISNDADTNYDKDYTVLRSSTYRHGMKYSIGKAYWMASRHIHTDSYSTIYNAVIVLTSGTDIYGFDMHCYHSGIPGTPEYNHGFTADLRPVLTVRADVILASGAGTEKNPYVLGL